MSVFLDEHVQAILLLRNRAAVRQVLLLQRHADDANDDEQNDGRSEPKIHRPARQQCLVDIYHTEWLAEGLIGTVQANVAGIVRQTQLLAGMQIIPIA